ncbi:MAG: rRNA pseudouridine synthase [Verrucomicrobia bacterium]|nr:rRNA pseudouridine synthase [Verrucomicrobiota bacterium]
MKRLSKVLAAAGVASRRACEELIFKGKVTVNGEIVLKPETHVDADKDTIAVDGDRIRNEQEKVYFILNKPRGYICSNKALGKKKLVVDLFSSMPYRLFTVGRLDRDTTGLLLITNDGHFAQEVIHPSRNVTKEYLIKTVEEITPDHLKAIMKGAFVEGIWVKPVEVRKVRRGTLKIIVKEGKKREVRVLVQKADLKVLSLHRIRIGNLLLGPLEEGEWRPLSVKERESLLSSRR